MSSNANDNSNLQEHLNRLLGVLPDLVGTVGAARQDANEGVGNGGPVRTPSPMPQAQSRPFQLLATPPPPPGPEYVPSANTFRAKLQNWSQTLPSQPTMDQQVAFGRWCWFFVHHAYQADLDAFNLEGFCETIEEFFLFAQEQLGVRAAATEPSAERWYDETNEDGATMSPAECLMYLDVSMYEIPLADSPSGLDSVQLGEWFLSARSIVAYWREIDGLSRLFTALS